MDPGSSSNGSPLVSVVLLNYKRREALGLMLDTVLRQQYENREIIVVDNSSRQSLKDLVEDRGPGIKVIELRENLGAGGGRSAGIRDARGEIVITLDDDMSFASAFEVDKVVRTFRERLDVHVLTFQVCDLETGKLRPREWCHPRNWQGFGQSEFETHFFVEGGCACRRGVYEQAGLYHQPLDIALQLRHRELPEVILSLGFEASVQERRQHVSHSGERA